MIFNDSRDTNTLNLCNILGTLALTLTRYAIGNIELRLKSHYSLFWSLSWYISRNFERQLLLHGCGLGLSVLFLYIVLFVRLLSRFLLYLLRPLNMKQTKNWYLKNTSLDNIIYKSYHNFVCIWIYFVKGKLKAIEENRDWVNSNEDEVLAINWVDYTLKLLKQAQFD